MGWFSKIAEKAPKRLGLAMMGWASIWGIRSPPEPEVVAQHAPRPTADAGPEPEESGYTIERRGGP
jgi:hypothetical protein